MYRYKVINSKKPNKTAKQILAEFGLSKDDVFVLEGGQLWPSAPFEAVVFGLRDRDKALTRRNGDPVPTSSYGRTRMEALVDFVKIIKAAYHKDTLVYDRPDLRRAAPAAAPIPPK